ncbi:MAG: Rrf2 family transcriptional regulator [Candidatus Marinimicrobia bacterium]|nr:Rrf2 family transcriptional regulator [Candidatus Neomarinimicrobiota bacterium]
MQITRAADYALRGMIYLARQDPGKFTYIREISNEEGVPEKFMRKLFHILHKSGFIDSTRGKFGGIRLNIVPEEVTMLDIIEAVDGPLALNLCLKWPDLCDRIDLCPMSDIWLEVQASVNKVLKQYTLKDIVNENRIQSWRKKNAENLVFHCIVGDNVNNKIIESDMIEKKD